jgi:hypothetical protein
MLMVYYIYVCGSEIPNVRFNSRNWIAMVILLYVKLHIASLFEAFCLMRVAAFPEYLDLMHMMFSMIIYSIFYSYLLDIC